MWWSFLLYFLFSFGLSLFLGFITAYLMFKQGVVDKPKKKKRKIHKQPVPLSGGLSIYISFFVSIFLIILIGENNLNNIEISKILALFLASTIVIVGGWLDDRFDLKPGYQFVFPFLASLILVIGGGLSINIISNPLGQAIDLNTNLFGSVYIIGDFIAFVWLLGMMYTTKFLDGLDGLVAGIVSLGALVVFYLSLQPDLYNNSLAIMSLVFVGSSLGFLMLNWHPAKVFLGEGGSLLTGLILGVLAILSKGKLIATLLVMTVPILDVLRVIIVRFLKKKPVYLGDREHLHHRLLANGFSQQQAVLFFYVLSLLMAGVALFLQREGIFKAGLLLFMFFMLISIFSAFKTNYEKD